jgi:ribosome-associated translation inhibitor RaiA
MVATRLSKRVGDGNPARKLVFELHSQDFVVPADVGAYVHDKIVAKLAKFGPLVTEVVVHLKDLNRGKGGVDKACHVEACLAGCRPVNVEERHHDLRAAIDVTIERTAEAVQRHLGRLRSKPLHRGRRMVRGTKTAS